MKKVPDKDLDGLELPLDTFCETCAFRKLQGVKNWIVIKQHNLEELGEVYDNLNRDKELLQ